MAKGFLLMFCKNCEDKSFIELKKFRNYLRNKPKNIFSQEFHSANHENQFFLLEFNLKN